jgi:hypothetical protein
VTPLTNGRLALRYNTFNVSSFYESSTIVILICLLLLSFPSPLASSLNLPEKMRHKSSPRCSSAGRVTAQLLLSFLALSTPISASTHKQQQPISPFLPPSIPEADRQPDSNGDHVFVGFCLLILCICAVSNHEFIVPTPHLPSWHLRTSSTSQTTRHS